MMLGNTRVAPGRQLRPMFTRPTLPAFSRPFRDTPALDHPGLAGFAPVLAPSERSR